MRVKLEELEARLRAMGPQSADSTERVDLLLELAEEHFSGDDPQRLIELTNEAIDGRGEVTIRTFTENGDLHVAVSDTGTGIAPDKLPHLFDPGFSTKGNRVKAGMGLLVSLNIVQKHGGSIEVESEEGKGSTFTIVLPRH